MARVAFVMTHPHQQWKNGADIGTREIARALEARGHACTLHVWLRGEATGYAPPPGVRLHAIETPRAGDPVRVARLLVGALRDAIAEEIGRGRYDAVIVPWGSPALGQLAAAAHRRVLLLVQNGEATGAMTPEAYRGLAVAALSPMLAREVATKLGREPMVLLNPVAPPARGTEGPGDAIGMVNICGEKGAIVFLNVAANLPDRRFVATGGWAGDAALYAQMATGLANVELLPPQDDMDAFYARLRVLLVPSLWREAFGRVAIEAQVRGIPVVCTDRCGAKDVIDALVVPVPPRPAGVADEVYFRDGARHAETIRAFLDAVVTLEDPENFALMARRARAAGERYAALQQASLDVLERWVAGG